MFFAVLESAVAGHVQLEPPLHFQLLCSCSTAVFDPHRFKHQLRKTALEKVSLQEERLCLWKHIVVCSRSCGGLSRTKELSGRSWTHAIQKTADSPVSGGQGPEIEKAGPTQSDRH